MNHLTLGLSYLAAGFRLINQPGLRHFVLIPLIINVLLFTGLFFVMRYYVSEFNLWFAHYLPHWLQWLSTIFWLLFLISFFLILTYLFVTIANLISAPFNSLLAEKVEFFLTGTISEQRSLWENFKDLPRIISRQITILLYYLPRACLLLILFFIPIIQTIAPILWFLFNAWYITLTYLDYPTDNHRIPLGEVRLWLKKRPALSFSFGVSVLVMTLIPVINCFVIPAAVAAATKLWVDEKNKTMVLT